MLRAVGLLPLWATLLLPASAAAFEPSDTVGLYGLRAETPGDAAGKPRPSLERAYLPDSIDLSPLMPPPLQQKNNSCVSFSAGYALRGYYSALEKGTPPGADATTPSPARLHAVIRQKDAPCSEGGSTPFHALHALMKGMASRGAVPDAAICTPAAEDFAGPQDGFRIADGGVIYVRPLDGAMNRRHLDLVKQQLADGNPVLAGFILYQAIGEEFTTLAALQHDGVYDGSLAPHGKEVGGHSVVIVGYDERRQAFLVQNSWSDGWANGGFGWISYNATLADATTLTFAIPFVPPPKPTPGISARTERREPIPVLNEVKLSPCSNVTVIGDVEGAQALGGFVESGKDLDALRLAAELAGLSAADVERLVRNVAVRPYPVCEALKTLEPVLAGSLKPKLVRLEGSGDDVEFGGSLAFEVTMPDYPSFLYLVYLDASGTVTNLVPRRGPLRRQLAPGTRLVFGDGKDGRQKYTAVAPAGAEAVIAITSMSPLFELEKLEDEDPELGMPRLDFGLARERADNRFYLSALRTGLSAKPDPAALPREVGAAVLYFNVKEGGHAN